MTACATPRWPYESLFPELPLAYLRPRPEGGPYAGSTDCWRGRAPRAARAHDGGLGGCGPGHVRARRPAPRLVRRPADADTAARHGRDVRAAVQGERERAGVRAAARRRRD